MCFWTKSYWIFLGCLVILIVQVQSQSIEKIDSSIFSLYHLDSVVVTAEYGPTLKSESVHQVHTISEEEIRTRGQLNLSEILQNELNLNITIDPILGQTASIQGIGRENILILIDGVPVVGRLDGGIDLSQIPSANVERIEIIKGALSAQYGSQAAGGVINIITKSRQTSKLNLEIQQQLESQRLNQTQLTAGIQSKRWLLRLNGNYFNWLPAPVDSLRIFDKVELDNGEEISQRRIPWSPKTQLGFGSTLAFRWSTHSRFEYGFQRFTEKLWRYGEKRRLAFMPYAIDQRFFTKRQDHRFRFQSNLGQLGQIESVTAWNRFFRTRENHRFDVQADSYEDNFMPLDSNQFSSILHRTKWNFSPADRLQGQWGGEILLDRAKGDRIVDTLSAPANEAEMLHLATWVSLRYQLSETLTLQGQFRYNYNNRYSSPVIPGFNVKYTPNKNWTVRASYGRGFRAPSLRELFIEFVDINHFIIGNPNLRAETSDNAEVSVVHSRELFWGHQATVEGNYFFNNLEDRVSLAQFQPLQFTYFNINEFESQGINVSLTLKKKGKYHLQTSASYMRQSNTVSGTATRRSTPVWEARNNLNFPLPVYNPIRIDIMHRFFGRQTQFFLDENDELLEGFIGGYHLLNISAQYAFASDRITVGMGIKNALNQTQVGTAGSQQAAHSNAGNQQLVQRDRSYFIRLQFRLNSGP